MAQPNKPKSEGLRFLEAQNKKWNAAIELAKQKMVAANSAFEEAKTRYEALVSQSQNDLNDLVGLAQQVNSQLALSRNEVLSQVVGARRGDGKRGRRNRRSVRTC